LVEVVSNGVHGGLDGGFEETSNLGAAGVRVRVPVCE